MEDTTSHARRLLMFAFCGDTNPDSDQSWPAQVRRRRPRDDDTTTALYSRSHSYRRSDEHRDDGRRRLTLPLLFPPRSA